MAICKVPISNLPISDSLSGSELIPLVEESGITKQSKLSELSGFVNLQYVTDSQNTTTVGLSTSAEIKAENLIAFNQITAGENVTTSTLSSGNISNSSNIKTDTLNSNNITNADNITTDTLNSNNITNADNITTNTLSSYQINNVDSIVTECLSATTVTAVSTFTRIMDIQQYELSGFDVTGSITVSGDVGVGQRVNSEGLRVDTTTLVVEPASNKVGINTAFPVSGLHIQDGGLKVCNRSSFDDKVSITPYAGQALFVSSRSPDNPAASIKVEGPVTVTHDLFKNSGVTNGFADNNNHFHSITDINLIEQLPAGDVKNIERVQERYYAIGDNLLPNDKAAFLARHRVARSIDTSVVDTSTATLSVAALQNSGNRKANFEAFFADNTSPVGKSEDLVVTLAGHTFNVSDQVRMKFTQAFQGPIVAADLFGKVTSTTSNTFNVELYGGNYKTTTQVPLGTDQTALTFDEVVLETVGTTTIVNQSNQNSLSLYDKSNFNPTRTKNETLSARWDQAHGLVKNEHITLITDGRGDLVIQEDAYVLDPAPGGDNTSIILVYGRRQKQYDLDPFTNFGISNWSIHKGSFDGIHRDVLGDNLINFNANNKGEYTAYQIGPGTQTDANAIAIGTNVYNNDPETIKLGYGNNMLNITTTGIKVSGTTDIQSDLTVDKNTFHVDTLSDKVGIGTLDPNKELTIKGELSATGNVDIDGNTIISKSLLVDTNTFFVDSTANNVGIGLTDPDEKLEVDGNIKIPGDRFYRMSGDAFQIGADGGGVGMHFHAGGSEKVTLLANGNVGIAVTDPDQKLEVDGNIKIPAERYLQMAGDAYQIGVDGIPKRIQFHTAGQEVVSILSGGNLGIGTIEPNKTLTVIGDISGTGTAAIGSNNIASGSHSAAVGGSSNIAEGLHSHIGGGESNLASTDHSFIGGGIKNKSINGGFNLPSSIIGGCCNSTSGPYSTITGGLSNTATGATSFIAGGCCNTADGVGSTIAGAFSSRNTGENAHIGGGLCNTASGRNAHIGGGKQNVASGLHSSIIGGEQNTASNNESVIIGGACHLASGERSSIMGGLSSKATNVTSGVFGGSFNLASGNRGTITGGFKNIANGTSSSVVGGEQNIACGTYSSAIGGVNNVACGTNSVIVGGNNNLIGAEGANSFVLGSNITAISANTTYVNNLSATDKLTVGGDATIGNNGFYNNPIVTVLNSSCRVGINKVNPDATLQVVNKSALDGGYGEALRVVGNALITAKRDAALVLQADSDNSGGTDLDDEPLVKLKRGLSSSLSATEGHLGVTGNGQEFTGALFEATFIQSHQCGTSPRNGSCENIQLAVNNKAGLTVRGSDTNIVRVGIGTNQPNQTLTVIGDISATGRLTVPTLETDIEASELVVTSGLSADGNTFTVDASNNKVGIGTANPSDELTVVGNISASGGITSNSLDTLQDVGVGGNLTSNNITGGTTLYVDASINKVGINEATPNEALTVAGNISATNNIFGDGLSAVSAFFATKANGAGVGIGKIADAGVELDVQGGIKGESLNLSDTLDVVGQSTFGDKIEVCVSSGEAVEIQGGNVGIGTGLPNKTLTVVGDISATGGLDVGHTNLTSLTASNKAVFKTDLTVDAQFNVNDCLLLVDNVTDRIGIKTSNTGGDGPVLSIQGDVSASEGLSAHNILGGVNNTAFGNDAAVVGGSGNTAADFETFVGGGVSNTANGIRSIVGGGGENNVSGNYSSIVGGNCNKACGSHSTVVGGLSNMSDGAYSFVGSGNENAACYPYSVVAGGAFNRACGSYSVVAGGCVNEATGLSFVGSGSCNIVSGAYSSVIGGSCNIVSGSYSSVIGGLSGVASGSYSVVAGGLSGLAQGTFSFVGGGCCNAADSFNTFVGGGSKNLALSAQSSVVGGNENRACSCLSFIGGGDSNITNAEYTTIGGGTGNYVSGAYSSAFGGVDNIVKKAKSTIVGGESNRADSTFTFIGGGARSTSEGNYSFIGGGLRHHISDLSNCSTIVGGLSNLVDESVKGFIGGGSNNKIRGDDTTIAGGQGNYAISCAASVVGGIFNRVCNERGFIGGGNSNTITAKHGVIGGGCHNVVASSGCLGVILGGDHNSVNALSAGILGGVYNKAWHDNSFIIGSNLNSMATNTTYVENLTATGSLHAGDGFTGNVAGCSTITVVNGIITAAS